MSEVTPDMVLQLTKPTDGFLCPLSANKYGIEFLSFAIIDYATKKVIFQVGKDYPPPTDMTVDFSAVGEDMYRKIKYNFSEDVLGLPTIQTRLQFSIGNQPLKGFRMIERHYFRNKLVKSFDFPFGFCIPGSTNTWDAMYAMPALSPELINDMIDHPYETKSDSFYFVNDVLVMHNKAAYKYFREDSSQSKKSYEDKFSDLKISSRTSKPTQTKEIDDIAKPESKLPSDIAEAKSGGSSPLRSQAKASKQEWSKEADYF